MRAWVVVGLTAWSGCAKPVTSGQLPERASRPPTTVRLESPVRVRFEERSLDGATATVVAHVERLNALPLEFKVRLEVPPGAKLLSGRASFVLAPNAEPGDAQETLVVAYAAVPAGDLVLHVDGVSPAGGFHFTVPYRFGRPAPEMTAPAATAPGLHLNGQDFGNSIPVN